MKYYVSCLIYYHIVSRIEFIPDSFGSILADNDVGLLILIVE